LADELQLENLCVVLVSTRNPLNMGAAARAISNFGVSHLRVVNPFEASFREAKSAVGAAELLKRSQEFQSVVEAVADCSLVVGTTAARGRELHQAMHSLPEAAPLIREHLAGGRVAVLFGSEKRGLSNEDLNYCQWVMHIPTREEHLSMNLGQAVAVCMYEIARMSAREVSSEYMEVANSAELERLTEVLMENLAASGYLKTNAGKSGEERVRRLVRRLQFSSDDAEELLGMLRKMAWKLGRKD
jgi:tRNA/rRNA methyltransferase